MGIAIIVSRIDQETEAGFANWPGVTWPGNGEASLDSGLPESRATVFLMPGGPRKTWVKEGPFGQKTHTISQRQRV